MPSKKKLIKYRKERVLLSDVLPFEIPVTFSNRHFYKFLTKNKIEINNNAITWSNANSTLEEIIKLLFNLRGKNVRNNSIDIDRKKDFKTIPFGFKISHKENDFRELTIIHPKNQLSIVDFYDKYKHLIILYCNLSSFSIRRTDRVASFKYFKDRFHAANLTDAHDIDSAETADAEYEHLKTYFVYKKYSNIHRFYESTKYHHCEKKYNKLFRFDISKCFDSIYSHSIAWALLNKEIVKDTLGSDRNVYNTFGGQFDSLMQDLNFGETNGIVIGPEFSRIFSEIILQRIDRNVEHILKEKEDLLHKVDYEIFRYVDDYFVFFNKESTQNNILNSFRLELKKYKLSINDAKSKVYEKPIITEITIAKQRIVELADTYLVYSVKEVEESVSIEDGTFKLSKTKLHSLYVSSNKLITKFKIILKETEVAYKDILNFTLSVVERKVYKIIREYKTIEDKTKAERQFTKAILEILDFTFFLYSVHPRVNTTIRLSRILRLITEYLNKRNDVNIDFKHLALKKMFDNICFILQKNKTIENTQVETLYLLIILRQLGREYRLDADLLRQYACVVINPNGTYQYEGCMNYFVIVVLLFYIQNGNQYSKLKDFLKEHIKFRFNYVSVSNLGRSTELTLLLFDCITCPYLDISFKRDILALNGVVNQAIQDSIINYEKYWFTKWDNFDFGKELDAKLSQEVY